MKTLTRWASAFGRDFWTFLTRYKAWWITPIVLILLALAALAFFSDDTGVLPGIYSLH